MIQGYWIQEFAASLLNYAQKTKIKNHHENTRYKNKIFSILYYGATAYNVHIIKLKLPQDDHHIFVIHYFTINHWLFSYRVSWEAAAVEVLLS
jgi:hypothetical protein